MKPRLRVVAPTTLNRTVTPRRRPNAELRTREYLTETEVEKLIKAARGNRYGHRDATMILVTYRHGLRVSELVDLRWDQVDFRHGRLHVRRVKQGTSAVHPIIGDELRALRQLQRAQDPRSTFMFTSERGSPFTTAGFAKLVARAGVPGQTELPGASTHAAARLRLRAGQQRARYQGAASVSRAQEYPAYGALHGAFAGSVQEFLAGLTRWRPQSDDRSRQTATHILFSGGAAAMQPRPHPRCWSPAHG